MNTTWLQSRKFLCGLLENVLAEVRGTDFAVVAGTPEIGMNCNFLFRSK